MRVTAHYHPDMKLLILNDLHIEFEDFAPPATDADVIIDGGYCGHEPTTVIDLSGEVPLVVRQGKGDISFLSE